MTDWFESLKQQPPDNVPVLVYTEDGVIAVAWNDFLTGWKSNDTRIKWGTMISYWQPLPSGPNEKPDNNLAPEVKKRIKAGVDKMFKDEQFKKVLTLLHDKTGKAFCDKGKKCINRYRPDEDR